MRSANLLTCPFKRSRRTVALETLAKLRSLIFSVLFSKTISDLSVMQRSALQAFSNDFAFALISDFSCF